MTLVIVNSCGDHYATVNIAQRWSVVTGAPTVIPLAGRRLGSSTQLSSTSVRLQQNIPGLVTYVCGFAFKLNTLVATDVLTFKEGTTDHVIIRVTARIL